MFSLGCIKFLESYYLILVTRRRQIGCICGHAIYSIDESQLITIPHVSIQTDVAHSKTELRFVLADFLISDESSIGHLLYSVVT